MNSIAVCLAIYAMCCLIHDNTVGVDIYVWSSTLFGCTFSNEFLVIIVLLSRDMRFDQEKVELVFGTSWKVSSHMVWMMILELKF